MRFLACIQQRQREKVGKVTYNNSKSMKSKPHMYNLLCLKVSSLPFLTGSAGDSDFKASIKLVSDLAIGDSEKKNMHPK